MRRNTLVQLTLFHVRSLLRNKIAFFFSLILPVILVGIFGTMYGPTNSANPAAIGLVDRDGGPVASALVSQAEATGLCKIIPGDEAALEAKLGKGSLDAILFLPEDMSRSIQAGEAGVPVTVMRNPNAAASGQVAETLRSFVSQFGIELASAKPALAPQIADVPGVEPLTDALMFLMPGQMIYMLLSAGLMTVAIQLASQRASGTLRHMFSAPLSMGSWAAARIISILLMALGQVIVLYSAAWLMFRVQMPQNMLGTALVLILSALATLGIGLAIGTLVRSAEAAFPVTMILFMVLAILGDAMFPLDGAPAIIHTLAKVMPTKFMTHALKATMMQGKGLGTIGTDLLVLVACAAVFNGIAIWRMRREMVAA